MRLILPIAALALAALAWLAWPRGMPPGLSVVGDGANAVRAALELPDGAGADVVLLRRAGSLEHLPEVARLCRGRCGPGVTRLRVLGATDRLVVEMSEMDGIDALDRGEGLPEALAACLARIVAAEAAGGEETCAGRRRTVWTLPYGL